jgi:glyoxylase-like metal-dependent hydrolase (beta-lactamase superfamily II)
MPNTVADIAITDAIAIVAHARENVDQSPIVESFFDATTFTVSHIVRDPASDACAIIDSVLNFDLAAGRTSLVSVDLLTERVQSLRLRVQWVLETHAHADHLSAAPMLQERVGGKLAIGEHITAVQNTFGDLFNLGQGFARDGSQFDRLFRDGERFKIGELDAVALHVPGHTPACVAYVVGDAVFVGDTLFMPDYGTARCDFPGGSAVALYRSIRRLQQLPVESRVFFCHDYKPAGREVFMWQSTIGASRASNIHIHDGVTEAEFVVMRETRDRRLSVPQLLLPAIQVNIRGGRLPDPESNGRRFLKLPLNAL